MMSATVVSGGGIETEPFGVHTGVKQGCVIAPTLFSIFISAIIHLTGKDRPEGVRITYRFDGQLFSINRFRPKGRTTTTSITELQYADDNALVAHSEEDVQLLLDAFAKAYKQLGWALNIKKKKNSHLLPASSQQNFPCFTSKYPH